MQLQLRKVIYISDMYFVQIEIFDKFDNKRTKEIVYLPAPMREFFLNMHVMFGCSRYL
jgi:hypothetical protein